MQNSAIEWTDHTFNPWWGCQRVSPGCEHCYAETLSKRYGHAVWGPAKTTDRRMMSANYWKQPIRWNQQAEQAGQRARVFCASMADVFEDHPQLVEPRRRLFDLISECSALDWLLLTKRPENIMRMLIEAGRGFQSLPPWIWIGTSVENQEQANKRIPWLLRVPAAVRFLSCEPLLGPVDLSPWLWFGVADLAPSGDLHWVIAGGESGHGARPMHPDWARSLRDQCSAAGVAFFFKQWGEYGPWPEGVEFNPRAQVFQWPRDEWNGTHWGVRYEPHYRIGKKTAGRLLDGRTWDELPTVAMNGRQNVVANEKESGDTALQSGARDRGRSGDLVFFRHASREREEDV